MISLSTARRAAIAVPATGWRFGTGDPIVPGRGALRLLGGGERYEVYLAWDEHLFAPVVAKVLRPHLAHSEAAVAALAAEAAALDELRHPGLVRSYGAVLDAPRPHLVLEFLDGPRLSTRLRDRGALPADQLVPLARQLCSVLQFLAMSGWVHLDVGPENVVLTSPPRLIGLANARPVAEARTMTRPVGAPEYRAPEARDRARFGDIGPATDVWALGATLFEAIGGRPLSSFPDQNHPTLVGISPRLPDGALPMLAEAIGACLQERYEERPTAAQVDELLEPLAAWAARASRGID